MSAVRNHHFDEYGPQMTAVVDEAIRAKHQISILHDSRWIVTVIGAEEQSSPDPERSVA